MKHKKILKIWLSIFIVFSTIGTAYAEEITDSDSTQDVCIPAGNEILSATLSVTSLLASNHSLDVSRIVGITDGQNTWDEGTVTWNNFHDNFTAQLVDAITLNNTDSGFSSLNSLPFTELVINWVNGTEVNHGVLLESSDADSLLKFIHGSEHYQVDSRPKLLIEFSNGVTVIQRLEGSNVVTDAWISEVNPDNTGAVGDLLATFLSPEGISKQIMIKFEVPLYCQTDEPGVGTPGYWKNHDWGEITELTLGSTTYDEDTLRNFMKHNKKKGDKSIDMLKHLAATTLNVSIGNDDSCIADVIDDANHWLESYAPEVPANISAESDAWQLDGGGDLMEQLDLYNNGLLECAASRD